MSEVYTCGECNLSFPQDLDVYNHSRMKCGACHVCGDAFASRCDAGSHMAEKHSDKTCDECGKRFFLKTSLDCHKADSTHKKKFWNKEKEKPKIKPKPTLFPDMKKGQTLQQFVDKRLRPNGLYQERCRKIVDFFKHFLHHNTKYSCDKVIKGGSLGKSTNILNNSDVDLVVFVNDFKSMGDFRDNIKPTINTLARNIQTGFNKAKDIEISRKTGHAVHLKLKCHDGSHVHEVDILPAINILKGDAPGDLKQIWEEMKDKTEKERSYYSVCLAQKQVEFVKDAPAKVKDLIRVVKYVTKVHDLPIKSYFSELLCINRWEAWGKPDNFDMDEKFRDVLEKLCNPDCLRITWPTQYKASSYCEIPENPVLLDPVNPYANVAPSYQDAEKLKAKAREILKLYRK